MKSIAIFAPYVGTVNRGAETFVIELTLKLRKQYQVDVYTIKSEKLIAENVIEVPVKEGILLRLHKRCYEGNEIYRKIINKFYFLIPDVIFQLKFSKKAFELLKNKNYDLLFPNNGVWGAYYSKKYREKNNVPYIYTGHGGIGYGEKKILDNLPNAYVCLTEKHLEWAKDVKADDVYVEKIPNGVNVSDFSRGDSKGVTKIVMSVGALTEFKRHALTINAMEKIDDAQLIIFGKGEDEQQLRQLAEKKIPNRYKIGSVSYEEIKEYYKSADVFVLPSLEEPFGIVYLEAMASNVPIVVPDDSQRKEIVGNAGLYCDVTDAEEYAKQIKNALEMDWGTLPLERAKLFDWEVVSSKYTDLIEKLT